MAIADVFAAALWCKALEGFITCWERSKQAHICLPTWTFWTLCYPLGKKKRKALVWWTAWGRWSYRLCRKWKPLKGSTGCGVENVLPKARKAAVAIFSLENPQTVCKGVTQFTSQEGSGCVSEWFTDLAFPISLCCGVAVLLISVLDVGELCN